MSEWAAVDACRHLEPAGLALARWTGGRHTVAHQSLGMLPTHAIGRPSPLRPQCGSSIEVSCPSGRTADPSPAAVLAPTEAGEPGRVALRHGLVVAVLERLRRAHSSMPSSVSAACTRFRASSTLGSDSTAEMTSSASAKALVRACRRTASWTRHSSSGAVIRRRSAGGGSAERATHRWPGGTKQLRVPLPECQEGYGFLVVGVDREGYHGVEEIDSVELEKWITPYVGEDIDWRTTYVHVSEEGHKEG